MTGTRVAAIDIGTNTVRLLVAEYRPAGLAGHLVLVPVDKRVKVVRLGEGVDATGRFSEAALERTLSVLGTFGEALRSWRPDRTRVVATSATRDAANRDQFLDAVELAVGTRPDVVSGDQEAHLAFAGVLSAMEGTATTLVIDLGGGSTEFVYGSDVVEYAISIAIGSVRLAERVLGEGPHNLDEVDRARAHVDGLLTAIELPAVPDRVVAVAGSFTSLAALAAGLDDYDSDIVDGTAMTDRDLAALVDRLRALTTDEIAALGAIDPGRAGVLTAGAVVAERALVASGVTSLTVSESDLLDGVALWAAGALAV